MNHHQSANLQRAERIKLDYWTSLTGLWTSLTGFFGPHLREKCGLNTEREVRYFDIGPLFRVISDLSFGHFKATHSRKRGPKRELPGFGPLFRVILDLISGTAKKPLDLSFGTFWGDWTSLTGLRRASGLGILCLVRRTPRKGLPVPIAPTELTTFDEANVGELGLISLHERIPEEFTAWSRKVVFNQREASVSCSSPEFGVPHGLDGDFATVLGVLYLEQGAPEDGTVHTTAYKLIVRAGFEDTGFYYSRLRVSLDRLSSAQYRVKQGWRAAGRKGYDTAVFSYIADYQIRTLDKDALGQGSVLEVRLAEPIVRNLRGGQIRPVDLQFLSSLRRAPTRGLYRLLNAVRLDLEAEPLSKFTVKLEEWAKACALHEHSPARVRKSLKDAHDELVTRGYLSEASAQGRGKDSTFTYVFAPQSVPGTDVSSLPSSSVSPGRTEVQSEVSEKMSEAALQTLRKEGVSLPIAQRLMSEFGPVHLEERLKAYRQLLERGYRVRSRSGLLVDVIRDAAGKYPALSDPLTGPTPEGRTEVTPRAAQEVPPDPMATLSFEERVATALSTLRAMLGRRAGEHLTQSVRVALLEGRLDPTLLVRELAGAASKMNLEHFVTELGERLSLEGTQGVGARGA